MNRKNPFTPKPKRSGRLFNVMIGQTFTLMEEPPGHRRDWSSLTRDKLLSQGYGHPQISMAEAASSTNQRLNWDGLTKKAKSCEDGVCKIAGAVKMRRHT